MFLLPIVLLSYFSVVAFSYRASWFFKWEGIRPGVKQWIEEIESDDLRYIAEQHLHVAENLYSTESQQLLSYPHPEIRCIAALALMQEDSSQVYPLSTMILSDKEMYLRWHYSCCFGTCPEFPAQYIHELLQSNDEDDNISSSLSDAEKQELAAIYYSHL